MSSFMTRWSVLREHEVVPADHDGNGEVSDAAIASWVRAACSAYLEQCTALPRGGAGALRLRKEVGPLPPGTALGRPAAVVVSASATEVLATAFVVAIRLRPVGGAAGGDERQAFNISCTVRVEDATGSAQAIAPAIRDELIALEHAARHFN